MNKKGLGKLFLSISLILIVFYVLFVRADITSVTLVSPTNNAWINTNAVQLNCSATTNAELIANITWWTDISGSWAINATNSTEIPLSSNATNLTLRLTADNNTGIKWGCQVYNLTNTNNFSSNNTFFIDRTVPVPSFNEGTTENSPNNSVLNIGSIFINLTITEANIANVTFILYNSTGLARNVTNYTGPTTVGIRSVNFSSNSSFAFTLNDGTYYFNATVVDNATNTNYTVTRQIVIDTTLATLNHQGASSANSSSSNVATINWTYVNFSVTETNPANITFTLYNSSNTSAYFLVNTTVRYLSGNAGLLVNTSINFSNLLPNFIYYYNATVTDLANNKNASVLRRFILDNTPPLPSGPQRNQTTVSSGEWINFTVNVSDGLELAGFIFSINISGGEVTNFTNSTFTSLSGNNTRLVSNISLITGSTKANVSWLFYVNDSAGNWNSTPLQSFLLPQVDSGGGGGGGGGGGSGAGSSSTAPSTPNALNSETHIIQKLTPGAASIIKLVDPDLGIKQIQVIVNNQATAVKIIVTKLAGKPASVTHEVSNANVYKYIEINKTNLPDPDLQEATLSVNVEKSFLENNKYDKNKVAVQRYHEVTGWSKLDTKLTSEDDKYVYYDARTPGFSLFAITVEQVPTQEEFIEEEVPEEVPPSEPPISVPPKKKSYLWAWIIAIIGVIGIVVLVVILMQKQKQKR